MNDPYEEDRAYDQWRYDQFGDVIVPDEYDDYYYEDEYDYTYPDEIEDDYDGL